MSNKVYCFSKRIDSNTSSVDRVLKRTPDYNDEHSTPMYMQFLYDIEKVNHSTVMLNSIQGFDCNFDIL